MAELGVRPQKIARKSKQKQEAQVIVGNILVQLVGEDESKVGPELDLPNSVTPQQLNILINDLQSNSEPLPYSFHIGDKELTENLGQHLSSNQISVETAVKILCRPQALFKVRPVSRCSASLPGHSEAVLSVNFSPNGQQLASGSGDSTVRFWDLNTQTALYTGQEHTHWVLAVSWSPDSRLVATGDKVGVIIIWDTKNFNKNNTNFEGNDNISGTKNGIISEGNNIQSTTDEKNNISTIKNDISSKTNENDGNGRAISGSNKEKKGQKTDSIENNCKNNKSGSNSKKRQNNAGNNNNNSGIQIRGKCIGHTKFITSISWCPAHQEFPSRKFVSGSADRTVRVWDAVSLTSLFVFGSHTNTISAVRWGGENFIYSGAKDSLINVWDSNQGKLIRVLKGHAGWVNALTLSSDFVLRTGPFSLDDSETMKKNSIKGDTHALQQNKGNMHALQQKALERYQKFTQNKERMVSCSDDNTMFMWDPVNDKKPIKRMTGHVKLINQACFSPDGRWLISASFDKAVKLWDGLTGDYLHTFRGHVGEVYQVCWSPDSRLLVSASKDSTLKVWDLRTRKQLVELPGHADEVFCVDWSPSGALVCSGGKDRVLKLWRH